MARQRIIQNSLISGEISPSLYGRQDLQKYYNAVQKAENVIVQPHGGMKRRGGLALVDTVTTGSRLFAFEFSITQNYVIVFSTADFSVYLPDGTSPVATVNWATALTVAQLQDMDIIQSADTIIITHEDFAPRQVQRQGSDSNWAESNITLLNIPKADFNDNIPRHFNYGESLTATVRAGEIVYNNDLNNVSGMDEHLYRARNQRNSINLANEDYSNNSNWEDLGERENVWSDSRGWPRTCTFHQGRLWFGGSKSKPTSIWGSVVNDFFNFDTGRGDVQADDAVFDVLDTDQYNAINNISSSRNLQVVTASGEFNNTAEIITPTSSAWQRSTSYGGKRLKPVTLDGATYFVDRFGKNVRRYLYDFGEGGYNTAPVSILAEHLLNGVLDLDIVRGSSVSVANLLYLVNGDGTMAVFNTLRKEDIAGWTRWTTNGSFKRVVVVQDEVFFIVERDGAEYLEKLDETLLLDHAVSATNTDRITVDTVLQNNEIRVVADGITQTTTMATGNEAIADRMADVLYTGLNYTVEIQTLPVSLTVQTEGNIIDLPKRVTRARLRLLESRGVYVNDRLITTRKFGQNFDQVFPLISGIESTYLLGYNVDTNITITQINPDPMTLLSLNLDISF